MSITIKYLKILKVITPNLVNNKLIRYQITTSNSSIFSYTNCYARNNHSKQFHTSIGLNNGKFEMRDPSNQAETVNVKFIDRAKCTHEVKAKVGDNVLYLAKRYGIELEGACEASLACSTCHIYVDNSHFDALEDADDSEEDMLDLAPAVKENSRLGCQIILTKEMDGICITLPSITRNFYVDGHTPIAH